VEKTGFLTRLGFAFKNLNATDPGDKSDSWKIIIRTIASGSFFLVLIGIIFQLWFGIIHPTTELVAVTYWISLFLNFALLFIQLMLEMVTLFGYCLESFSGQASQISAAEKTLRRYLNPEILAVVYIALPLTSMIIDDFGAWDFLLYTGLSLSFLIGVLYFAVPYVFKVKISIGKENIDYETAERVNSIVEQPGTPAADDGGIQF